MLYLQMFMVLFLALQDPRPESNQVRIISTGGGGTSTNYKNYDLGPSVGDMLKYHYIPALEDYAAGRYEPASRGASYVLNSPYYLDGNPRREEFLSTARYIRGMIYLYHSVGVGRFKLAKEDFEGAVKHNPKNYVAYLELSRVYSQLYDTVKTTEYKDTAIKVLNLLLGLKPDEAVASEARAELKKLGAETSQ